MFNDASNALTLYVIDARTWLDEWYDHARLAGFVEPPITLDETIADRLEGYFQAGLTPADGAIAFFGTVH
ncbi:hypothetical protein AWB77_01456 [Caballeronia fortuita]|uniref:Uncharacterized protein n=1 Tax=Caballeronia fortuita TaxID=1777138 RepID=A0A158A7C2_9BURK|nr:hypothetical protein [Caballeronia fortuita]SAK53688.1 hypothetical protein AWB77_01456 [Caballeronia fortuita]